MSTTVAPVTVLGPLLVTTIVYVRLCPGTAVVTPSVFEIDRSAVGVKVSVSVAELLPGVGSVYPDGTETLAVLAIEPVAEAETVPVTV